MKKIFCLLFVLSAAVKLYATASGDSAVAEKPPTKLNPEVYLLTNGKAPATLLSNIIFTIPTFNKVPWFTISGEVYVQRNSSFGEMLVGPSYTSKLFEGGVMFGFQTGLPELRVGPWFAARSNDEFFSTWVYYECGPDWSVRAEATLRVSKATAKNRLRLGLKLYELNIGTAINFERSKTYLSIAPVYGMDDKLYRLLVSIGWNM